MAVLMTGWSALLRHNLARGERVIADNPGRANYLVLSADFLEYRDYYRTFPTRLADFGGESIDVEFYKRPLYGPISGLLSVAVHRTTGLSFPRSMEVILSFYASLAVMLLVGVARRLGLRWPEAGLLGAIGALSFSWLSIFSVPESYSLSVCAALLAMHSGMGLAGRSDTHLTAAMLRHSVIAGVAGCIYLPLCGAALMTMDGVKGRREWLTVVLPCVVLAVAVAFAPHLVRGQEAVQMQLDYGSKWTALSNAADLGLVARVFATLLWFGLIAPVRDFVLAPPSLELSAALRSWPVASAVVLVSVAHVVLFIRLKATGFRRSRGALVWLGALLVFHVFFNPGEVLLHVSVPVSVLLFVVGAGVAAPEARNRVRVGLAVAVALLAVVNLPAAIGS